MGKDCASNELPAFRVIRGEPTTEELAALVGALLARTRSREPGPLPGPTNWVTSARPGATGAGRPARRGPAAWRTSALPS